MQGELSLEGAPIADVHLTPQPPTRSRQLDFNGPVVSIVDMTMSGDPPFLFQTIEATTQARRREPQIGCDIERSRSSSQALQRGQHIKPAEPDIPIGLELVINSASDLTGDRLKATPCANSGGIETGQSSAHPVARIAASNALTASFTSSEVTTSGGIQRIVRLRVPAVIRIT